MRWMSPDQFYKTLVIVTENWLKLVALQTLSEIW